ncbi:MAG: DUF928 domain-containing protein [Acidobacteriia bacterium]|nr:DUF928 domain-containing protein [Terriglobia bacterium]
MKVHTSSWLIVALIFLLQFSSWAQTQPQTSKPPAKPAVETAKPPEAKKAARPRVVTDLSGFDLLDPGKAKKQTMIAGATRGGPRATALAPRLAKFYGSSPVFQWSYPGKTKKFNFVLRDDSDSELLRTEVVGTEFRYPATAPQLAPGRTYFWTVEPAVMMLAEPSAPVGFVVVPAEQRQEIDERFAKVKNRDGYAAAYERAQILTDQRLWYDAIGAYTDLIAKFPDRPKLYEQRGMIYAQFEVTQAPADQDFARAEELRAKP